MGQSEERDDAVDNRCQRVADEQIKKRVIGEEARGRRSCGECQVYREPIHAEGEHALLRPDEIDEKRVTGGAIQLGGRSREAGEDENGAETASL